MNLLNKVRREVVTRLSKSCLKSARITYLNRTYRVPMLFGVGSSYFSLREDAMSRAISRALAIRRGTVLDVGVNIGQFLLKLRAFSDERYIGFEANPMCNFYVQELIRLNRFSDVLVLPVALGDEDRQCTFYARRYADKMGSLNEFVRSSSRRRMTYDFEVVTRRGDDVLNSLNLADISLIKIDVEGAELAVIRGLASTIQAFKPLMWCEVWRLPGAEHPDREAIARRRSELYKLLSSMSYMVYKSDDADRVAAVSSESEFLSMNPKDNDFLFCHESEASALLRAYTSSPR